MITTNWRIFFRNGFLFRFVVALMAIFVSVNGGLLAPSDACCQALGSADLKGDLEWMPAESDLIPDPAVVAGILPNGFRYVMMNNGEPKDRVSMHLLVQAGSLHESEKEQGIAHFIEHMMFNGSENFPPGELVKYFQLIGMQFGPDANAHTSFRQTVYDVLLPGGSRESIEGGLAVLKDYAQGAFLLQDEIDRERGVILSEKRSRDSAAYRTYVATLKFEFPDARFARRLPIGQESVIRSADHGLMKQFYDTWYRPEKMVLVMVGEFDIPGAEKLAQEMFGTMGARAPAAPEPQLGGISHEGVKTFYHPESEIGATTVAIEVVRKIEKPSDSSALRKEDVIRDLAQRILQNRLEEMLSKPDAPFTSAAMQMGRFMQQVAYSEISADCQPENWEATLARIEQTLRQALSFGFNENELARVKREFVSYLETAVARAATRESGDIASEIIWHIDNERVFLSPEQEMSLLLPCIRDVTLGDVHAALKKQWAPDHRLVLVTGNASLEKGGGREPEEKIRAVYEASALETVAAVADSQPVFFPYLPAPQSPGGIADRRDIEDLGITQVDFGNGVRLNLKKTDFEADKVRVSIAFGEGKYAEPGDRAGLAMLAEEVVNESGLGRLDKNELAYALAGTQVVSSFEISEDRFAMRGACASRETELLMQLLYARLMDPGLRPDALHLAMARLEQTHQSLSSDIDGALSIQGRNFLAGGDSRFGMPPLGKLKALTLEDIRSWILPSIHEGRLEVNVVGDMQPETIIGLVATYFGSLPKRGKTVKRALPAPIEFPVGKTLDIRVGTQIQKGLVVVAYPTDDYWDISRTRRTSVLADIFSEKLREKIREQLGASYSPFAYNQAHRAYEGYGMLQAYVHVAPDQASFVVDAVKEISRDILENGVSAEALDRSLKPILTSIKDYRRTNDYWLDRVMTDSLRHPEQLDWSRSFEADYAAITVEDVQRLAAAYLVNENAACITIVPKGDK